MRPRGLVGAGHGDRGAGGADRDIHRPGSGLAMDHDPEGRLGRAEAVARTHHERRSSGRQDLESRPTDGIGCVHVHVPTGDHEPAGHAGNAEVGHRGVAEANGAGAGPTELGRSVAVVEHEGLRSVGRLVRHAGPFDRPLGQGHADSVVTSVTRWNRQPCRFPGWRPTLTLGASTDARRPVGRQTPRGNP